MHRLVLKYAAEAGTEPDAYLLEMIEEHWRTPISCAGLRKSWKHGRAARAAPTPGRKWSASLAWTIEFDDKAIRQLKKLGDTQSKRIRHYLHTRIKPLDDARQ